MRQRRVRSRWRGQKKNREGLLPAETTKPPPPRLDARAAAAAPFSAHCSVSVVLGEATPEWFSVRVGARREEINKHDRRRRPLQRGRRGKRATQDPQATPRVARRHSCPRPRCGAPRPAVICVVVAKLHWSASARERERRRRARARASAGERASARASARVFIPVRGARRAERGAQSEARRARRAGARSECECAHLLLYRSEHGCVISKMSRPLLSNKAPT